MSTASAGDAYAAFLGRMQAAMSRGVTLGLDRVEEALRRLGSPELRVPAVQIAGTNGKGSTAAAAEAILRAGGVKTGLFTSPHLLRFTERIRVEGREVAGARLAALEPRVAATGVPLTYFEIATILAFLIFAEEGVEVAVMETGLGGRLDAVTTCRPVATAITNIARDHTALLGDTLPEIAREKAGIIKAGIPLAVGRVTAEVAAVLSEEARRRGAPVAFFGRDFGFPGGVAADAFTLRGPHQESNGAVAVWLATQAAASLGRRLELADVREGLGATVWPGRLERIGDVWLDCAHNADGAAALAAAVGSLAPHDAPTVLVTSIVADKDAAAMGAIFSRVFRAAVLTRSSSPRALPAHDLLEQWTGLGFANLSVRPDLRAALAEAQGRAAGHPVAVAGSIFLVGDMRAALLGEDRDPVPTGDPAAASHLDVGPGPSS